MAMIYLIRHGQASFFDKNYDKLTEKGVLQSQLVGKSLNGRNLSPKEITSGTLVRHKETQKAANSSWPVVSDSRWNEYNHKELLKAKHPDLNDSREIYELVKSQPNPLRAFQDLLNESIIAWMGNKNKYETSWQDYKSASWEALNELSGKLSSSESAVVFTSGGPIASLVVKLLNLDDQQFVYLQNRIVNTSITKVLVGKSGLSLSTFNDYGHLEHAQNLITYR